MYSCILISVLWINFEDNQVVSNQLVDYIFEDRYFQSCADTSESLNFYT